MPEAGSAEITEPPSTLAAVAVYEVDGRKMAPAGYLEPLRFCLERKGEKLSPTVLMGLTGESFRLFFDPRRPLYGLSLVTHNPLRAAGATLGFDTDIPHAPAREEALSLLRERLEAGEGCLLQLEEGWACLLPGSDFHVHFGSERSEDWGRERLLAAWPEQEGLLELGPRGYYFFALGEKKRSPSPKEQAVAAMRRGWRLLTRQSRVEDCSVGINAYRSLEALLVRHSPVLGQQVRDLRSYDVWHQAAAGSLAAAREAAAVFLEQLQTRFEKEEVEHLEKAVKLLREAAGLISSLPALDEKLSLILANPAETEDELKEQVKAIKRLAPLRRQAIRIFRRLYFLEHDVADELERTIAGAERKRQ